MGVVSTDEVALDSAGRSSNPPPGEILLRRKIEAVLNTQQTALPLLRGNGSILSVRLLRRQ